MAIQIGSNYKLNSRLFLDDRQSCESLEILQANIDNILYPEGFKVYCVLEKAYYINVANNGEEPIWEKDSLDISLEINDTEYSSSSVYSSLKIEQMKDNMNADITQTEDDIDDIDYRLTTVETEVLKINDIVGTTIKNLSGNTIVLSQNKVQCLTLTGDTTIILPSVSAFKQIELYVNIGVYGNVTFNKTVAWENGLDINMENTKYKLLLTYVNSTMGWLGECHCYQ